MIVNETIPLSGWDWEAAFAPYDDETYQFVVERLTPQDVVLDIGAGDLRLARRLAAIAQQVYAVEKNAAVIVLPTDRLSWPDEWAWRSGTSWPPSGSIWTTRQCVM